jgi:hypothetical protein
MIPVYFSYLLKLSLCLAAVSLFYRLVLQNLTFYHYNRWYLVTFTALSFLFPLVDVAALVEPKQQVPVVDYIPQVEVITANSLVRPQMAAPGYDRWNWLLGLLFTGSGLLLAKSGIQVFSFLRLRRRARLLSDQEIKIYQIDADILPFSFGRSIFLNRALHREQDLQEIIRHELVHVRQGHTADIIWMELVCILNWYNPFAWLLRYHLRQNLEFIADSQVLQTGTDKKHYQYLLLQVTGVPAFHLANQFNFSPLKKRILMMNKMPSTRPHLVKFLFLLPLVSVLLLAFRGVENPAGDGNEISILDQGSPAKQKEPKNLVTTKPGGENNTLLAVFQDGTQEKYDLTTQAGKEAFRKAQLFFGDAYNPENLKRGWPEDFKIFLNRNQQVAKIKWRYDMEQLSKGNFVYPADRLYITLKSGAEEVYTIENNEDLAKVENKFGKLPMLPPPPPVVTPGK